MCGVSHTTPGRAFRDVYLLTTTATLQGENVVHIDDRIARANCQASCELLKTLQAQLADVAGQLHAAQEQEQQAVEQFRVIDRMKEDFLSNVSHELRTPLTAIKGYLDLLPEMGPLAPEQEDALVVVLRNLSHLHQLIDNLLAYSSLARGQMHLAHERVDMAQVIAQCVSRAMQSALRQGVRLEHQVAPALTVMGDREKLLQILIQLLDNALKFSRRGQQVTLSALREGALVRIDVRDMGIGMSPEQLAHAFIPFAQGESGLTRRYPGLGLGLPLAHHLVCLHGGDLHIVSTPEHGTTVTISLPAEAA